MALNHHQFVGMVDALSRVLVFDRPADALMSAFFRQHRKLGAGDRFIINEAVFTVLRHYYFLSALLAPDEVTPRRLAIAALLRVCDHDIDEVSRHLDEEEKPFATSLMARNPERGLAAQTELPEWVIEKLAWPKEALLALGHSLQQKAPLDLRVNTVKGKRKKILAQLAEQGITASETPWSPIGIRLTEKIQLQTHPLYTSGLIEIQDEGSQLLGLLVGAKRGQMVADFCAGAGGKTLQLASAMANTGYLYAFDVSDSRLKKLTPRLKRAGVSNVYSIAVAHENDARIKRLYGKMDRVLVDAPCSGLGTLRRHPDIKFRQSPQSVKAFNKTQAAILASAAQLLTPGGRLVYATCSLLADENEHIVEAFLEKHAQYSLMPVKDALPKKVGIDAGDYLQLLPHVHNTDGFFAAVIVRQS